MNIPASIMSHNKPEKDSKQRGTRRTLYIDKDVYEKVKADAEQQDRSVSYTINAILKKHYGMGKRRK